MNRRNVIGIDLGTTLTKVAFVNESGNPEVIPHTNGELSFPSVIWFDNDDVYIGEEAKRASVLQPGSTISCVKREIANRHFLWEWKGKKYSPEELSALIIRKAINTASRKLGTIDATVITVPAYFNEARRKATQDAGSIAGIEVLDIINEPTAAALAYGIHKRPEQQTVMVYDLGGGTFDVTLVRFSGYEVRVLATDGDVRLGGRDWDERIIKHVCGLFMAQHGLDPREDKAAYPELVFMAEEAKIALTRHKAVALPIQAFGKNEQYKLTREQFCELTQDLLGRTQATCELVLCEAGITWREVDRILLVGGSSRMPMVHEMLEASSVQWTDAQLPSDLIVAQGAAIHATIMEEKRLRNVAASTAIAASGESTDLTVCEDPEPVALSRPAWMKRTQVTNVNSHSLGVEASSRRRGGRKTNIVLIPKNTPLPHTVKKRFGTSKSGQTKIDVKVLEGDAEDPAACRVIGRCRIQNLPPSLSVGSPIEISYTYMANGSLSVKAVLVDSGIDATMTLLREQGLADWQVKEATDAVRSANIR